MVRSSVGVVRYQSRYVILSRRPQRFTSSPQQHDFNILVRGAAAGRKPFQRQQHLSIPLATHTHWH